VEATIFKAWIFDQLKPHAAAVKVAHPLMLRAIAVAKKKKVSHIDSGLRGGIIVAGRHREETAKPLDSYSF